MLERLDVLIAFVTVLLGVSLLITILNQMVAGLLGYRATYLADGIKDLLTTLDPDLKQHADKIVKDVLTHELASDSMFAHQSWAPERWRQATALRPEELSKLLVLVSKGKPYEESIGKILEQVNPTLEREAKLMLALAPDAAGKTEQLINQLADSTTKAIGRLEAGFYSTMDRVRQRFTLQMRIWTVVFSVVLAFVFHMDATKIYSQVSTDPALRAGLSSASNDMIRRYAVVTSLASGNRDQKQQDPPPAGGAGNNSENTPGLEQSSELVQREKLLATQYNEVRRQLSDFNLDIFEVPEPWYRWHQPEIVGMLAMVAFLSLGAPFWYNVLKNLVNLRSQVAQKQEEEQAAS